MTETSESKLAELYLKFKTEVYDREEINADCEYNWYALAFGWALGIGCTKDEAEDFTVHCANASLWYG